MSGHGRGGDEGGGAGAARARQGAHGHGGPGHARGDGDGNGPGPGRGPHAGGRDRHGNPGDLEAYLARLEDPERSAWQKPDEVIAALGLREGAVACDVGAGPGVITLRLARAVGPTGRVHAIDVEPRMLELLRRRAADAQITNVRPLLAEGEADLPPEPCDAILLVNTFHHFTDGPAALRRLATALRPGGRLAIVDFHEQELPVGPPPDHKVSRAGFLAAASAAGLTVVKEETFLPFQYFFLLA